MYLIYIYITSQDFEILISRKNTREKLQQFKFCIKME